VTFNKGITVNGQLLVEGTLTVDDTLQGNGSVVVWDGSATISKGILQASPATDGVAFAVVGPPGSTDSVTFDTGVTTYGIIYAPPAPSTSPRDAPSRARSWGSI
jgi:hypothetical protein